LKPSTNNDNDTDKSVKQRRTQNTPLGNATINNKFGSTGSLNVAPWLTLTTEESFSPNYSIATYTTRAQFGDFHLTDSVERFLKSKYITLVVLYFASVVKSPVFQALK